MSCTHWVAFCAMGERRDLGGGFGLEAGWTGIFTRDEAPGAMPNGSRVQKARSEGNDAHADGATGTVLGSALNPEPPPPFLYFIEWDDLPRRAVGIRADRVEPL